MKRAHLLPLVLAVAVLLFAADLGAQTVFKSNYFPFEDSSGARKERPEQSWERPGTVSPFNKFCVYRTVSATNTTSFVPNLEGAPANPFGSYPPSSTWDASYADDDYDYLPATGLLEYWGAFGQSCQNKPTGVGVSPTTTIARTVPNIGLWVEAHETAQGIVVGLEVRNFVGYAGIAIWAMGQGQTVAEYLNLTAPPYNVQVPLTTGTHTVQFTIGTDPGEVDLPIIPGQKCMIDGLTEGTNYQIGVMGYLAGGTQAPPIPGFTDYAHRSTILITDPMTICVKPFVAPPSPPESPANFQAALENVADVMLTWTNEDPYDHLILKRGDEILEGNLAGDATQYKLTDYPFGQVATFTLRGVGENGLDSEPVTLTLQNPPMPEPPAGLQLLPGVEQLTVQITEPANAVRYVGENKIQGYEIYAENLLDPLASLTTFAQSSGDATVTVPLMAGFYRVSARTQANNVFSPASGGVEAEVESQPVATLPVPTLLVQQSDYDLLFFLNPDQTAGFYDRVELHDDGDRLMAILSANSGWQSVISFDRVGHFSNWSAKGFRGTEFSEASPVEFDVALQTPDFWYWINDVAPDGSRDKVGRQIHLKIAGNFPWNNPYGSNQRIVIEINNQKLTQSDILAFYAADPGTKKRPHAKENHQTVNLAGETAGAAYVHYIHSLPSDHSQAGEQRVTLRTEVIENGVVLARSAPNQAKFAVGMRRGDINNDDRVDVADVKALIEWWTRGTLANRPACLETLNADEDQYIPLPLYINVAPPAKGRAFAVDPATERCDTNDGPSGNDNPLPESIEDGLRAFRVIFDGGAHTKVAFVQFERGKPLGYDAAPLVPGYACFYNRYANPNRPVFNELNAFYPNVDATCKYGPYEPESKGWCHPGDANDPNTGEPCDPSTPSGPPSGPYPNDSVALYQQALSKHASEPLPAAAFTGMFQIADPVPSSSGSGGGGGPKGPGNLPATGIGPIPDNPSYLQ